MNEFWAWIIEHFNNRELASAIWLTAILFLVSFKSDVRQSLLSVAGAVLDLKLLGLFSAFAVNVLALIWLGSYLNIWITNLITPTIVWYLFGGLPLLAKSFDVKEDSQHFLGYAKSALGVIALLEFIFVADTFSLAIELFFTPVVALISMTLVMSERKPELSSVKALLTWLMVAFMAIILWHSVSGIAAHPDGFFTTSTIRSFVWPIYLTIFSIPFFYLLHCYSNIEGARIQIDQKTFQSDKLKSYARKQFFWTFFLRPWLLRRATRQFHSLPAKTSSDVDQIIQDIRKYERTAKESIEVDEAKGWSPHEARKFLAKDGIRTGDYHPDGEEEWWASSAPIDLDEHLLPNTVSYHTEGTEGLVTVLRLKGHFVDDFDPKGAVAKFLILCQTLLKKGAPVLANIVEAELLEGDDFSHTAETTTTSLEKARFPSEKGFNLTFQVFRNNPNSI